MYNHPNALHEMPQRGLSQRNARETSKMYNGKALYKGQTQKKGNDDHQYKKRETTNERHVRNKTRHKSYQDPNANAVDEHNGYRMEAVLFVSGNSQVISIRVVDMTEHLMHEHDITKDKTQEENKYGYRANNVRDLGNDEGKL